MTGAQEALPDTGPQPVADAWGTRGSGGFPQAGSPAYPDQWYDNPRLNPDQPRPGGARLTGRSPGARPADPRLEGINYGELRYDEPDPVTPGEPGYDEPLDDESWYEELRRSGPAYPQGLGPQHPSGPQRRVEPQAPGYGQQPGFPQAPDRAVGYGQPRGDRGGSLAAGSAGPPEQRREDDRPRSAGRQPAGFAVPAGSGRPGNWLPQRSGARPAPRSDCSPRPTAPGWTPCGTAACSRPLPLS